MSRTILCLDPGESTGWVLGTEEQAIRGGTCKRNHLEVAQLIKDGDYATDINYVDKLCNIIERWNLTQYDVIETPETPETPETKEIKYYVQAGAYEIKENANVQVGRLHDAGFDAFIKYVDGYYKIQAGAYAVRENAEAQLQRLKDAGFDAFIKE